IIMPGITHWQHPRFFAYFPANASPASVLGEQLAAGLSVNALIWQTSPAASELEGKMMGWLLQAIGLGPPFAGVIYESASVATFSAVLVMRERLLDWKGNRKGLSSMGCLRLYASENNHLSVEKAAWMAGIGRDNLVKIKASATPPYGIDCTLLAQAIERDLAAGLNPAGIIGCIGGTTIGACDDLDALGQLARRYGLYLHVDAAWAGTAMICPQFRPLWRGIEQADSFVFNPHKWMGVSFDCSAFFTANPHDLKRTLQADATYLQTDIDHPAAVDYANWSVQLGRRFRALKLWFHMRANGLAAMRKMVEDHVAWTQWLADQIRGSEMFCLTSEPMLALLTFRAEAEGINNLDGFNHALVGILNASGKLYLTVTRWQEMTVIRFQIGALATSLNDVQESWGLIEDTARALQLEWLAKS
ncbi:MAG: pyridoxal-dependent decarboxylase, partial [Pseudomonadota bacterium]